MRLYLVQHGASIPEQIDPQRPLSAVGRQHVEAIRRLLAAGVRSARTTHSGKLRAPADGRAAGHRLHCQRCRGSGLRPQPERSRQACARMIATLSADAMLVGHLPFMARLAGRLVTGDEDSKVIAFVPGTVLCLERAAGDRWTAAWTVRPELATREA